jgi:hypothetical protein
MCWESPAGALSGRPPGYGNKWGPVLGVPVGSLHGRGAGYRNKQGGRVGNPDRGSLLGAQLAMMWHHRSD